VTLGAGQLHASGVAIGADPVPYHLDYVLACDDGYLTRSLSVHAHGADWSRDLLLSQNAQGKWDIEAKAAGHGGVSWPGGNPATFSGALDCDLGLSPLTNTMPVLRHGLLGHGQLGHGLPGPGLVGGGEPVEFLMAWVRVPDLSVHAMPQRYTFVRRTDRGAVINYASGDFSADVTFDADGLVVDYPGLATRA
jgi:uncharacterized protein